MVDFNEAYIDILVKIEKAIEDADFSKAKEYSGDLISTSYVMKNKYGLLLSEYLYSAFDDLEVAERLMSVGEYLRRMRGIKESPHPRLIRLREPTDEELKDLEYIKKGYKTLMNSIINFLSNLDDKNARFELVETMADFRFRINEITKKYG